MTAAAAAAAACIQRQLLLLILPRLASSAETQLAYPSRVERSLSLRQFLQSKEVSSAVIRDLGQVNFVWSRKQALGQKAHLRW